MDKKKKEKVRMKYTKPMIYSNLVFMQIDRINQRLSYGGNDSYSLLQLYKAVRGLYSNIVFYTKIKFKEKQIEPIPAAEKRNLTMMRNEIDSLDPGNISDFEIMGWTKKMISFFDQLCLIVGYAGLVPRYREEPEETEFGDETAEEGGEREVQ